MTGRIAEATTAMAKASKTTVGIPDPRHGRGVVLAEEARTSRRRLYPVSAAYGTFAFAAFGWAWLSSSASAVTSFVAGVVAWTWVEYMGHKYLLHGVYPPGPGRVRAWLHRRLDHLHWEHHERPWDGRHINGTLTDTWHVAVVLAFAASGFAGAQLGLAFVGGLLGGYVAEEWLHHSVHFYAWRAGWFRSLKARHFHHHSARGKHVGFGLSSPLWDAVLGTLPRDPALARALGRRRRSPFWPHVPRRT